MKDEQKGCKQIRQGLIHNTLPTLAQDECLASKLKQTLLAREPSRLLVTIYSALQGLNCCATGGYPGHAIHPAWEMSDHLHQLAWFWAVPIFLTLLASSFCVETEFLVQINKF